MIYTLIKKELRQLLPIAILLFILAISSLIYSPISGRLDQKSWGDLNGYMPANDQVSSGIFLIVICFVTAYSLFPREHDDKTIEYLYSLPTNRISIFLSKFIVAMSILCGASLLGSLIDWILQLFNNQPFSRDQFNLRTVLTGEFIFLLFMFTMLSYGVLLSFFRRFGLLIFGMFWVIISSFKGKLPFLEYLNVFSIISMEYRGQTLLIPWKLLFINTGMGAICLCIACFLWSTPAEQFSIWYQNLFKKRVGTIVGAGSLTIILILFLTIFYHLGKNDPNNNYQRVQYVSYQTSTFSGEHYRFTYPQSLRKTAHEFINRADDVYIKVRNFLTARDSETIVVDLTEESHEHEGLAALYKIRMDIRKEKELTNRLRVFAHETTHVFALLESEKKLRDYSSTHFFNEGLSEYVSYTLYPDADKLEAQHLLAVTSWKRNKLTFDDMVNNLAFRKKYSEHLFYAIGHLWVKAMSDTYGDQAISRLLHTFGREGAPTNLSGRSLWQDTLQAMNCDLEKINTTWLKTLNDLSRKYEEKIEGLPQIRGGVVNRNRDEIILSANLDRDILPENFIFLVRYRKDSSVEEEDTHTIQGFIDPDKDPLEIRFYIPSGSLVGRRFEYQFGYIFDDETFPYFEEWQSGGN